MRVAVWIALGWLGVIFWTAVAARLAPGHVFPDAALVVIVFLALHREPVVVVVVALALGYLNGRQALAPGGLHEFASVLVAVIAYAISGQLAAGGAIFFAVVTGCATMLYHLLLFLLLIGFRGPAGFSSWATASLVVNGVLTGALAAASYPLMQRLEARLSESRRQTGLQWR